MGMIRKWLCSAFRVGQPQRDSAPSQPVSGVPDLPSHPAARPPILASFRHPGEAASVGPRLPSGHSFSDSKMPLSVSMLAVLHGETLYLRPPANQKRKLLYDLASFRCLPPAPSTLSSTTWTPSPTTTTQTSVSPSGAALDLLVAAGCPPKLMLLPAPGPRSRSCPCRPSTAVSSLKASTYEPSGSPAIQVTHLTKKTLKMRHKISTRHRNQLKMRNLQRHS